MDSCQRQAASQSTGSGRFSCSTTDVLSCIMHVISKGCIRRNEENPQIVEFVPEDPSTPQKGQAQFSFSRSDSRKDTAAIDSLADIRCDPDLWPQTSSQSVSSQIRQNNRLIFILEENKSCSTWLEDSDFFWKISENFSLTQINFIVDQTEQYLFCFYYRFNSTISPI